MILPLSTLYRKTRGCRPAQPRQRDRRRQRNAQQGFTLVELLIVVTVLGVVAAVAIPTFQSYREGCCVQAAVAEIAGMIREAKQNALCSDRYYAIGFDPVLGRVSLIADKGKDGKWNTVDDRVVRSFSLVAKGGGLCFGYGAYGPLPTLAAASDGISFQCNNTLECNPELTGNAGAVYLITRRGRAMAITMNSKDYGYTLYRWSGKKWLRI
jgi:prepilin-type N-terminal cleavage/methylation domain-containing protein